MLLFTGSHYQTRRVPAAAYPSHIKYKMTFYRVFNRCFVAACTMLFRPRVCAYTHDVDTKTDGGFDFFVCRVRMTPSCIDAVYIGTYKHIGNIM